MSFCSRAAISIKFFSIRSALDSSASSLSSVAFTICLSGIVSSPERTSIDLIGSTLGAEEWKISSYILSSFIVRPSTTSERSLSFSSSVGRPSAYALFSCLSLFSSSVLKKAKTNYLQLLLLNNYKLNKHGELYSSPIY